MIRAAISPIVLRRRGAFAATCGAACLAAPFYGSDGRARCSAADGVSNASDSPTFSPLLPFPTSSALPDLLDDVERCRSLILPTAEALVRAARLVGTAAIMAVDYKAHYLRRKDPDSLAGRLHSWVFLRRYDAADEECCEEGRARRRRREGLEGEIYRLERDLEEAQYAYVDPGSSSGDRETTDDGSADSEAADESASTPSERMLEKRRQKKAMMDVASSESTSTLSERTLEKRQQKEAMLNIASQLAVAEEELSALKDATNATDGIHERNARRLLELLRTNGGVYVKVGQHLANLDLLLPEEYIRTLSSLFDDAPVSSYEDVRRVVREELGSSPEELFGEFSREPFASASLAQVHAARCRETGRDLAIKVQHRGLRETSRGDLFAMATVVGIAERLFDEFNFGWICEELTPQLPKELDFGNEGKNAEAAAAHLGRTGLDCVVPRVYWNLTSERVLTMEFEEGFRATDVESIDGAGICRREVAKLISSVFNSQIFDDGFVHCDPHEANVLLREHPSKKGKPQMVLVDHGLYKTLDGDFQEAYARLWRGIVMADVGEIKSACGRLGVREMYPLLAAMLTSRPFDEVVERSRTRSLDAAPAGNGGGDRAVIRGYAQRYLREIVAMLDVVPRQMLLIFKMNDCLRHVDAALGSPANNLVVAGRYASRRVFESDEERRRRSNGGIAGLIRSWLSYVHVLIRINSYEILSRIRLQGRSRLKV